MITVRFPSAQDDPFDDDTLEEATDTLVPEYPADFPNFREWHEVPVGATIPADVPFIWLTRDGSRWAFAESGAVRAFVQGDQGTAEVRRFTEKKISHPMDENDKSPRLLLGHSGKPLVVVWVESNEVWLVEYSGNKYGNLAAILKRNPGSRLEFKK